MSFSFLAQVPEASGLGYQLLDTLHISGEQAQLSVMLLVWNVEWYDILWLACSSLLALKTMISIWKIFRLARPLQQEKQLDHILIYTNGKLPTFSFLNMLFWDNSLALDAISQKSVLTHELIHIRQKHSWDLLVVEALKVVFWFNPFLYLYHRALKEQHEYLADASATVDISKQDYQHALVSVLFKNLNPGFVHSFNQSQIKKRIQKMNQLKSIH